MKRLRRWLFNLLASLSLLLCICTSILWARSYNILYILSRDQDYHQYTGGWSETFRLDQGRVMFLVSLIPDAQRTQSYTPPPAKWTLYREPYWYAFRQNNRYSKFAWRFWYYGRTTRPSPAGFGPAGYWSIGLNLALISLAFAILPAFARIRYLRAKYFTRRPGLCNKCGYDLRATPDRCPECGTIPSEQISGERHYGTPGI